MPTSATNVNYFDKSFYESLQKEVVGYARETDVSKYIPSMITDLRDAEQVKVPIFGATDNIHGGSLGANESVIKTIRNTKTFELSNVYGYVYFPLEDLNRNPDTMVQEKAEQLKEMVRQANIALFKGIYSGGFDANGQGQGEQLVSGILDQATQVTDLDGTDSALTTSGDVYKALTKMVNSIPYRYRSSDKKIIIGMTSHFYQKANSPTFTNTAGQTEWERFMKVYGGVVDFEKTMISDDLFLDSSDTLGTHDRLFAFISDPMYIKRIYSAPFGMISSVKDVNGGIIDTWRVKECGAVIDANAVMYSEQISWA